MRVVRVLSLSLLAVALLAQTLPAAVPAADLAWGAKKRQRMPAGELRATYQHEAFEAPAEAEEPPASPLRLDGQGISLYYLIPMDRIKNILPAEFTPFPGPDRIWFRVDFIQWTNAAAGPHEAVQKGFVELAYRFEVKRGNQRGTYPIKIYADQAWAGLWMRQREGYDAFISRPQADVNFSPFMHFFQVRKSKWALALVEAKPRQGMGAQMGDIFSRKEDAGLWEGGRVDFLLSDASRGPSQVRRQLVVELKAAQPENVMLSEPKAWNFLAEEEIPFPDKVFILESIQGTWGEK